MTTNIIDFGFNAAHDLGRAVIGRRNDKSVYDIMRIRFNNLIRTRPATIKLNGRVFNCGDYDNFETLYNEIYVKKLYDIKLNSKYPTIYDLGANIGISILHFKELYPDANIVAFEPDFYARGILLKNLKDNKVTGVHVSHVAVSDHDGSEQFYYDCFNRNNLSMGLYPNEGTKYNYYNVPVRRFSHYVNEHIHLLKMDIEGAEGRIIKDLYESRKLSMFDNIVFEHHTINDNADVQERENSLSNTLNILVKNGFIIRVLDVDRQARTSVFHAFRTCV